MKRQPTSHHASGSRIALPMALIGSLVLIALVLYAVDTGPLRTLLMTP